MAKAKRNRPGVGTQVAALAILLVGFCAYGSVRWTVGGARGVDLVGEIVAPLERPTLRIASFNIQGGVGADGKRDVSRIADQLAHFDLIGLNEVRGTLIGRPSNIAQDLGQRLSMAWLFAPSERRWWHDDFGNGVLSAIPVDAWERTPMPTKQWRGYRNVVRLTVPHSGKVVTVFITHVDRQEDHDAQLKEALRQFRAAPMPAILMGDLNTTADDPTLRDALNDPSIANVFENTPWPNRIDWILCRGMDVIDCGTEDKGASDHPLVWAEVKPKADPQ